MKKGGIYTGRYTPRKDTYHIQGGIHPGRDTHHIQEVYTQGGIPRV